MTTTTMRVTERKASIQAVLRWLRRWGITLEDLPKGERGFGEHCPVGRALQNLYEYAYVEPPSWWYEEKKRRLPKSISLFVGEFDSGLWPEYERE